MLTKLKKQLGKLWTALSTAIVVVILFVLQFVIIEGDWYFWKKMSFWINLAVMLFILLSVSEIYWRNGSKRGELNDKYIGSAIEYSVRVNRIKNCTPCKTDDFYTYISEKNVELFIEARDNYLETYGILKEDYYKGHKIKQHDEKGNEKITYSKPHCEMSKKELSELTRNNLGIAEPYYTKKQIKIICKAIKGDFHYEILNGTEILSGIKYKNNKYATSYSSKKNKANFLGTNIITMLIITVILAIFSPKPGEHWSVATLVTFFLRLLAVAWRAITSDDAGYKDIVEIKRGVNINRANITTMYATARELHDLFKNINEEILEARKQFFEPIVQEVTINGRNNTNHDQKE